MKIAINFATGNFRRRQRINSFTAKRIGLVDKVISYSEDQIDRDFKEKHIDIFQYKRGYGLWLWKPYFINKTLQAVEDNDYVIYSDSGSIYVRDIDYLINMLEKSNQDIMLFELPLIECQWTRKSVFLQLDAYDENIRFTPQILGTFIIIRKTSNTIGFIKEWLELCERKELITPAKKDLSEDEVYIEHREDQAILSILAKKRGIIPYSDPSDYGKFPYQYLFNNIMFNNRSLGDDYSIKKVTFLLYRNANLLVYFSTYFIKCMFSMIGLSRLRLK